MSVHVQRYKLHVFTKRLRELKKLAFELSHLYLLHHKMASVSAQLRGSRKFSMQKWLALTSDTTI